MRKFLLLLTLLAGLTAQAATRQTDGAPVIYGSIHFASGWSSLPDPPYGIYSIPAEPSGTFTLHRRGIDYMANGGGTYVDGKYYMVGYTTSIEGAVMDITYSVYDTEQDWKLLRRATQESISSIPTDYAYDVTTDRIYGCFHHEDGAFRFGILDRLTGRPDILTTLDEQLVALAANSRGELYAIGLSGMLYRVAVKGREVSLSEIGTTGQTVRYAQSACFDPRTDKLYWALSFYDTSKEDGIYEVDTKTGAVNCKVEFTNGYAFTGIYTTAPYARSGAPAKVKNLSLNYPKGTTTGNISFTLPSTTVGGQPLSGELTYNVIIDEKTTLTGKAAAGSKVSISHSFPAAALHYFSISATNAEGRGQTTAEIAFVGHDAPRAENVSMKQTTKGLSVSWTAPAAGVNGGYVDATTLRYKVVRMPEKKQVYEGPATSFDDVRDVQELSYYWYTVTASASGIEGEAAESNRLKLGEACSAPYLEDFTYFEDYRLYQVLDLNGDNCTWSHGYGSLIYAYSDAAAADDWAITPPLRLDPEFVYQLSFTTRVGEDGYTERLSVASGGTPTADAMTETVVPAYDISWTRATEQTAVVKPQRSGHTYIGFHALSEKSQDLLYLDNIAVEALTSVHAPDTVTAFTIKPGANGALSATLHFTLPTVTLRGDALSAISEVEIYRGLELIATLDGRPGQTLSHTDNGAANGFNTYTVVVCNDKGTGIEAAKKVYVGEDRPTGVRNLKAADLGGGKVQLTWEAPLVGENGGYLNPATLQYRVFNVGGQYGSAVVVNGTSFTDELTVPADEQQLVWYEVITESPRGSSEAVASRPVALGTPYDLPYAESFAGKTPGRGPWDVWNDEYSEWRFAGYGSADPQDNDGGEMLFLPALSGATGEIVSPKLSVKNAINPVLSFWLWHNERTHNFLTVKLRKADGNEVTLQEFDQRKFEESSATAAWTLHRLALKDALTAADEFVQLVFEARNAEFDPFGLNVLYLDNILLRSYYDHDLQAGTLSGATSVAVGETLTLELPVTNMGVNTAEGYTVTLFRDGKAVDTQRGTTLAPHESTVIRLSDTSNADAAEVSRYKAVVNYAADLVPANNASPEKDVNVLPGLPFIETLAGEETEGRLVLTWEAPIANSDEPAAETVTEDFEGYTAFTTKNMGLWLLYDGDASSTGGIINYDTGDYFQYENAETPMAYMVFNPYLLNGISSTFAARSGEQVLACFVSTQRQNDDWLISPEVDGAQTISFWAKAPDCEWFETEETVEVLYSSGIADIPDFKLLETITVGSERWTEYKVALPEGAKYFALRTVSHNQFVLFIDDITYRPAQHHLSLKGYNVYCNGTKLNAEPLAEPTYTVAAPKDGDRYQVTAVYNLGESALSNSVIVGATAIDAPQLQPAVSVRATRGGLSISAPEGTATAIYRADGSLCRRAAGSTTVRLPQGVYIVKWPAGAEKVLVK